MTREVPVKGRINAKTRDRKKEIVFSMKSRLEFLNGFSARKDERKRKGNLKNLKKERKAKREEQSSFKHHVQSEYTKAVDAVVHNLATSEVLDANEIVGSIEEKQTFYPAVDEFGDVSIEVTCLESPQFIAPIAYVAGTKKIKTPVETKGKKVRKAVIFNPKKKKEKTKQSNSSGKGLKRVKNTVKPKKKKHTVHSRSK